MTSPRTTTPARTRAILERVFNERWQNQEARYGEGNVHLLDGTGPETRWLLPFTNMSAQEVEVALRGDYEGFEEETGNPTWLHLVREEIAEAFQESDPGRLEEELIQVAALCVSWAERLAPDLRRTPPPVVMDEDVHCERRTRHGDHWHLNGARGLVYCDGEELPSPPRPERKCVSCGDSAGPNGSCGPSGCLNRPA